MPLTKQVLSSPYAPDQTGGVISICPLPYRCCHLCMPLTTQVLSSPYATPSQGGNAGGVRTSQTMLPNISHSNSNNQSASIKTTAPNASTNTSKTAVTIVTSNKSSSGSIPSSGTTTTTTTTAITTNRQLASAKETKMSGEDIRLKMTHASSASSARKSRDKPDRGNWSWKARC